MSKLGGNLFCPLVHVCIIASELISNTTISHYNDVIMTTIASQITSFTVVYSIVYSGADQRKHQSSTSLAFVRGIHRDRWISRTKSQLRGKCFQLMTSSCHQHHDDFSTCSSWQRKGYQCFALLAMCVVNPNTAIDVESVSNSWRLYDNSTRIKHQ